METLKKIAEDSFRYMRQTASYSDGSLDKIEDYVEALEKFKEDIENAELLSKKYRVIAPYSNYPVENNIQFYYSADRVIESYFTQKNLKYIDYHVIEAMYKRDPERYNWLGHDCNWVCTEGGDGHAERIFNQAKFNNMVIQHSTIIADYIKSDSNIKLSIIKGHGIKESNQKTK